ncbi:FadR/GntR family transcriptional regulator [Roseibium sp. LAB1]
MKPVEAEQNIRERARSVADALRSFIETGLSDGTLSVGDRLPTEKEMMEQFGGGRTIIRKTLTALEAEGKVIRRVGSGTFVADSSELDQQAQDHDDFFEQIARNSGPQEVMELRLTIEPDVAAMAATRGSAKEVGNVRDAYQQSLKAISIAEFEQADDKFHRAIAIAARNYLFCKVYDIVSAVRNETEWGVMKKNTLRPELRQVHSDEHGKILECIENRDASGARQAMEEHLVNVNKMLFASH